MLKLSPGEITGVQCLHRGVDDGALLSDVRPPFIFHMMLPSIAVHPNTIL